MKRLFLCFAFSIGLVFAQVLPKNIYAGGISYTPGQIAGTGLLARLVVDSGTYLFTVVDALPTAIKPFVVNTQFGGGVAQKIATIGNVPIFIPTSAGVSYNEANIGWAWTTGALGVVRLKGNWRAMPNVRLIKSSVSGGTGYQVIIGALFGWGE
jgi:hypothetical protein